MIDDKHTGLAKVSLDHWRALEKVVDEGGYARAAEALGKSQSTVSHSIQRLEDLLGTRVLRIQGRRAVLTEVGAVVLRRPWRIRLQPLQELVGQLIGDTVVSEQAAA